LAVVKRVRPTRRRGVITRRLVGERSKCEAIRVKKRRCKSPWLIRASGGRVLVLNVLMVRELTRVKRYIESISKSRSALGIGSGRTGSLCELRELGFEVLVQLVVRLLGIGPVGSSGYGARPI